MSLRLPDLTILPKYTDHTDIVSSEIRRHRFSGEQLRILEAGCGRDWPYQLDELPVHLTGVDTDNAALEARLQTGDLDDSVHGDLREVNFPPASFDIIYCKFVLEHINGAEAVLDRFLVWLKPGGLLILMFPNRESIYSLFTRLTPFWFHVFFKKHFLGEDTAGQTGFGPYPTYSDKVTGRENFHQYCRIRGINIISEYGVGDGRMPSAFKYFMRFFALLSFKKLKGDHNNLLYVLKTPAS